MVFQVSVFNLKCYSMATVKNGDDEKEVHRIHIKLYSKPLFNFDV